jgi:hypothetical protein
MEGILAEMRDNVSYLEDLEKSNAAKLTPVKDKIKEVAERLSRLAGS